VDISDERLHWLNITFPIYIEDIQNSSLSIGFQDLPLITIQPRSTTRTLS
jgi:hypothetical protein